MLAPGHSVNGLRSQKTRSRPASTIVLEDTRLNQLAVRGFVPFEMHVDGTRLYRRAQLQVVANARSARWARYRTARRAGP